VRERSIALDVVADRDGRVAGVVVAHVNSDGRIEEVTLLVASAVVVATGGMGQAYAVTTNPAESTGDGLALAWRAGAEIADVEFVQFHPTAFWQPDAHGQQLLVSEAVRGEGATLIDATGRSVMHGVHPLGDLAPRDVVATAIAMRLREAPGGVDDHVYLDATSIGADLPRRFPTVVERCRAAGVDPVSEPIPVAPAAHFACGGVRARLDGTTSMPGLFAIGEVAATGLHGANRLASNGVTEGLVAGRLVAERLAEALPESGAPAEGAASGSLPVAVLGSRSALARAMSRSVGPLRDADGLSDVLGRISASPADRPAPISSLAEVEATNLRTVSTLVSRAALAREESRGSHRRLDFGQPSDAWQGRLVQRWDGAETSLRFEPLRHQEGQP
jgi:L-aspartate oxidase